MIRFDRSKRIAILLSLVVVLATFLTGYTYYQSLGDTVYSAETYLTNDVFFEEKITVNANQAVQHTFTTDIQNTNGSVIPYVFVGDITGRCNMTYMMGLIKEEGYKIIAGVNGDFYDTVSGVPLGMTIHEGKLKNSGLNYSNAIGFKADGSAFTAPIRFDFTFTVNDGASYPFGHVNKPKGSSNGLHYYNDAYGASTKTSGDNIEVVLTADETTELSVNGSLSAIVDSVNLASSNTPIGENQIILSADTTTANAANLTSLVPGDKLTFSVTDQTGVWGEATEAIGAYQIIAQNGFVMTTDSVSNPRTCVGIKPDGTVMLFTADGRKPGYSVGMNLTDAANYLIERGCTTVINMDGGGSTTLVARMPGDIDAKVVNLPSDGKERSISNGLIFVTQEVGSGNIENLHMYPLSTLMMPGAQVKIEVKATDEIYMPVAVPSDISFDVDGAIGHIASNGLFVAGENEGEGEINASAEGLNASATIKITTAISINPDKADIVLDPGNTTDINVKAYSRYVPVITDDSLFTWTCDESIGAIDGNGVFKATDRAGVKGKIYISYNGKEKVIPVQVGPGKISFADTNGHWAQNFIEILAAKGVVQGMGEDLFSPDAQLTRAQFVTMMSNTIFDLDVDASEPTSFNDVHSEDWYAPYVNWAFEKKIVNGNPDGTFAPEAPITREQMAVILSNFAKSEGITYKVINGPVIFTDDSNISPWAFEAVSDIVESGIMNGRPEGNYDPLGFATRAEASKVIYGVVNLME